MKKVYVYVLIIVGVICAGGFLSYAYNTASFPFELKPANIVYKYYETEYVEPKGQLYIGVAGKAGNVVFAQAKFDVENKSDMSARYAIKIKLFDKGGFLLDEATSNSDDKDGDLSSKQSRTVYINYKTTIEQYRNAKESLIEIHSYKTALQIEQERQENQLKAKVEQDAQAEAYRKAQAEKRDPWLKLKKGMGKDEVEALLGKPLAVKSYNYIGAEQLERWDYEKFGLVSVEFNGGKLNSWKMP